MTKEEVRAQWVTDLRSGKFKQISRNLCNLELDGYCCLGVLTLRAVEAGICTTEDMLRRQVLAPQVRDWAGLTDNKGVYTLTLTMAFGRWPKDAFGNRVSK